MVEETGVAANNNNNSPCLHLSVKRTGGHTQQQQQRQAGGSQPVAAGANTSNLTVGNLYVQPPTRQGNPGNKSFDSTILPPPPAQVSGLQGQELLASPPPPPPPRPPLPPDYVSSYERNGVEREEETEPGVVKTINFIKQQNQLGIRLSGGNKTGIVVSAVQGGSQAELQVCGLLIAVLNFF